MISNLNDRKEFWGNHYFARCQGNTPFLRMHNIKDHFKNKNVLEIGPGEGRQFDEVYELSSNYHIMDISESVLNLEKYSKVDKTIIKDYSFRLGKKFDIVHFWYVVHHILEEELYNFLLFVKEHTEVYGRVFFNYQLINAYNIEWLGNDGKVTSIIETDYIERVIKSLFNIKCHVDDLPYYRSVECVPLKEE